ncbi:polysaccharide biosynthesis/export family protein [Porphyromonas macacae]|uniref:polysaccharide biosynthesis/export family protein n=1 Tax=Porphyromonas macacae TaxID=28115 RepID=UPI0024AE265C|nr:polysaccharide biosynthesis/export family protein [Porphyromonas macacae]
MKKYFIPFGVILFVALFLSSCSNLKEVVYLQNKHIYGNAISTKNVLFDATIKPKNILSIEIKSADPELSAPFNLSAVTVETPESERKTGSLTYLVDNKGEVELAVIGAIYVNGLTEREAEKMIREKLSKYLNNPTVHVRIMNYKISVLGEVTHPGVYSIENGKVNIFEALSLAGDMTIYGNRKNIKLLREDKNGGKQLFLLNITDANIVNSPYYYLQQGDVVYVEPSKVKANSALVSDNTTFWISTLSLLTGLVSILVTIL